ncbi:hypothetical protein RMATCC62417_11127 [Rhizopus microsporus]|nr:hypothetical protein RMATCC62417_11127 [Rhizopus microsporus]
MPIRSFSTSLLPLLRSDLSVDIRDAFLNTIDQAMVSVSDYIIAYGIQLYKLVLLLESATFINEGNNTIALEEQYGVNVQEILSEDFSVQDDIVYFPPPLNKDCVPTVALEKELANLFKSGHLQTIHAHYFSPRGVDIDKLTKHPCEKALFNALPKRDMMVDESIEPHLMKMSLNKYMTNFKNLRSNKFRYTRLLNRVITILLRIHLAPKRERLKREKKSKQPTESPTGSFKMSYNRRKRLFTLKAPRLAHPSQVHTILTIVSTTLWLLWSSHWRSSTSLGDANLGKAKDCYVPYEIHAMNCI